MAVLIRKYECSNARPIIEDALTLGLICLMLIGTLALI